MKNNLIFVHFFRNEVEFSLTILYYFSEVETLNNIQRWIQISPVKTGLCEIQAARHDFYNLKQSSFDHLL